MDESKTNTEHLALFTRLLYNKYFTAKSELLEKLMPKEDYEALGRIQSPSKECNQLLFNPKSWLSSCDPSWYVPLVEELDAPLQPLFLDILPKKIVDAFVAKTKISYTIQDKKKLPDIVQNFLFSYLYQHWQESVALPKELLEPSELQPFLACSKNDLRDIIDLLSMHDLVDEVRHIVDKRILEVLSKLLTKKQQAYLKMCLRQKTKPHAPTFSLRDFLREPQKFSSELRQVGIKRFGTLLSGENPDFIWHVLHTLDRDTAKQIQQHIEPKAVTSMTKLRQLESLQILQFLKASTKREQ
jgi:hypothetical protein